MCITNLFTVDLSTIVNFEFGTKGSDLNNPMSRLQLRNNTAEVIDLAVSDTHMYVALINGHIRVLNLLKDKSQLTLDSSKILKLNSAT